MDLSFDNDISRLARFRRELRNPSMWTIFIIVTVAAVVVFAPFAHGWVETARSSFKSVARQKEIQDKSMISLGAIVPSRMGQQVNTMIRAEGPVEWRVVSFRAGPCDTGNLSQLPASKYSTSIATACNDLDSIQQRYSGSCFLASDCNVPEVAKNELKAAMGLVWEAFSDAGFVLPYDELEQQVYP